MKSFLLRVVVAFCLLVPAVVPVVAEVGVEAPGACTRKTGFVVTEIMYKPASTNALEFVEVYNSNPFEEEIGGYRLDGEIDFTFPEGTMLDGESYLVVAKDAAAFQAEYGLSGVQIFEYGDADGGNSLGSSGTLRLVNSCGGIVLEIDYNNNAPWPVAADGAGHSLVLARPSYGENDPHAWEASDLVGGSPGTGDTFGDAALRKVVINEILAHTDDPQLDTIELYNHSNVPVDISGCTLSDEATTNKFTIPGGTVLAARGFAIFDQVQMGFSLNAGGETIYFWNAAGTRMIDAVQFGGQENGVSIGRYPNGGAEFHRMAGLTLGSANGARRIDDVVINEIMYDPISGDKADEFVELYNQGSGTVDLGGWRLRGGIGFEFPDGAEIPAGGYVVVARDALRLQTNYAQLNASNTFGGFSGKLGNGGDRVKLNKPDTVIDYDDPANPETNQIHIVVDDVTYGAGGQWPVWAKGGGSSLERVDPRANPRRPTSWADSDETGKATWTDISVTGLVELGARGASRIEGGLQGAGECLLDDVQVLVDGANRVNNPTFNSNLNDWVMRGSHERSSRESNGYGGTSCLHVRASTRCDTGANQISGSLSSSVAEGSIATISAKAKWQKGYPWFYLRLHGNYLEAPVRLDIPVNLGTPGLVNTRAANAGPAVDEVSHSPAVPSAGQDVVVTARIADPDGLTSRVLYYRIDPSSSYTGVAMVDNGTSGDAVAGDGTFSATIPGQSADTLVAFYILAFDGVGAPRRFPGNTPDNSARLRECLVRFGDATRTSSFGTYRMWFTQAATTDWETRLVLSNEPVEGTFVYNDSRVIYNFGAHYAGSPYHQNWTGITNDCHYSFDMPLDDKLLGTDNFNKLHGPGNNPFQDATMTREQAGFWVARKLKLPWLYRRYVNVYVNGVARKTGWLMEDTQVPGSEFVEQYWPDDADGSLHKANFWWEYSNVATASLELNKQRQHGTELLPYYNADGELHAPRYRWNWGPRSYGNTGGNDFSPVLDLIAAANSGDDMTERMQAEADMEEWMRVWALRKAVGDLDHFGCQIAQNMYMYKPTEGRWALLIWDMNHLLGNNLSYGPGRGLFPDYSDYGDGDGDTTLSAVYANPAFRRMSLRVYKEIANGPFQGAEIERWLDARYAAFVADGLTAMSPDTSFSYSESRSKVYDGGETAYFSGSIKDWLFEASTGILARVAQEDTAAFALTSPASVSTGSNRVKITGTAPVELASMTVNGVECPVIWTSVTEWSVEVVVVAATSPASFELQGLDVYGVPIAGATASVTATVTGGVDAPEDSVAINEILYNPTVPGGEFVELYNRSSNTAFDLTGWRINGLGYTFPPTVLAPGAYLVVDEFDGKLDPDGEKLTLYRPVGTNGAEAVVDQVRYEAVAPWPATPAGTSLQLMDAAQDNRRAALWAAADGLADPPAGETLIDWGATWKYRQGINLDGTGWQTTGYSDSAWPSGPAAFGYETSGLPHPIQTPLSLGTITYYFRKTINFTGTAGASLKLTTMVDDGLVVYVDGVEVHRLRMPAGTPAYTTTTTSFEKNAYEEGPVTIGVGLQPGTHVIAVELHQTSTTSSDVVFDMKVETDYAALAAEVATPGAANNVGYPNADIPALWLNEAVPSPVSGNPWVELYNAGATALDLGGYSLGDGYGELDRWPITAPASIAPGEFIQISLGGGALTNGSVALARDVGGTPEMIDYLNYGTVTPDWSYGDYPDGDPCSRTAMYAATPGAANTNESAPLDARINEWMADNDSALADAMDGGYADWFEIYNPGDETIDLGGYFLTDDLSNPYQFEIPSGGKYTIPANGFLLVWADNDPEQNELDPTGLHVNFALSKNGEAIALVASDGRVIDSVAFGSQATDQSEGRMYDGGATITAMESTPGAPNQVVNSVPVLQPLADAWLYPGETVSFTATASDAESAFQSLEFSLEPGAPVGATITPGGSFSWAVPAGLPPSAWPVAIRVEDNGTPPLDDAEGFTLHVIALPLFDYGLSPTGEGLTLGVETITGRNYSLTYKDSLLDTHWLPLGVARPGDGLPLEWEVSTTNAPKRYYQLYVEWRGLNDEI